MTEAFPLRWPAGKPRTKDRRRAAFSKKVREHGKSYDTTKDLTIADALGRLQTEIDRMKVDDYVLSSNVALRLDGKPRSGDAPPADPGVCLYFTYRAKPHALPCDTYDRVADNVAAIAKHIEATRAIERYGVASLEEMFTGFAALPSPNVRRPWREVFGFAESDRVTRDVLEERYRALAKKRHPDLGGSEAMMAELNGAHDDAMLEAANA